MKLKNNFYLMILQIFILIACKKDKAEPDNQSNNLNNLAGTGWNYKENFSQTIPVAISYGDYQSESTLPSSIDLTTRFPPVGNQGQLGTCVAWATGYNTKTYLDGVSKNLSYSQLQSLSNQYSPTDLFFSIPQSKRSCNYGTNFEDAFNILISRGVNSLDNVPYDEVCRSNSPGNSITASENKIKNYRRIQGSINEIKQYLAQGNPVVIGAKVNREFQQLRGSDVLKNLNYTGDEGGHAMVISGYNDLKRAFRIINSWGKGWGDDGYLWVDYEFLVNKFCVQSGQKSLFVAFNDNSTIINPSISSNSPDLTAIVSSDFTLYPAISSNFNARRAFFNVKNIGNQTITASSNWNIYYLWVNAFNANNYGLIFRGEFTTEIPQNTYQNINTNYTRINYDLPPGASLSEIMSGLNYISWDYFMPQLHGNFYLVMYVDKGNSNEYNQTNNIFYVTQTPKYFNNGYSNRVSRSNSYNNKYNFSNISSFTLSLNKTMLNNENSLIPYREISNKEFLNSYTSKEIISFLNYKIKNGGL